MNDIPLDNDTVIEAQLTDNGIRCKAENRSPAPNAIELFADHTDEYEVQVERVEDSWIGYLITEA